MADILLDSITNDAGTGVFDKLMSAVGAQIENQYLNNRITGSDYANVYLSSIQSVLQQSVQYTMQEQLIEAQIEDALAGIALKAKQLEIAGQELAAKTYEVGTLLPDQHNTNEADNALKAEQLLVLQEDVKLKKAEADAAYVKMLASIDKEMGYSYTLDVNGDVVRSSLADTADGTIDYDRELKLVQTEVLYTDRILKDKEAAKLGLDNVMKVAEADRAADPNFVYAPSYIKG